MTTGMRNLRRIALAILIVFAVGGLGRWFAGRGETVSTTEQAQPVGQAQHTEPAQGPGHELGWRVGELRDDGLRLIPSGRADASAVMDPEQFTGEVRDAYWIATQIPEVLNQLYCWCRCADRGQHRSTLQCFEDAMGVSCGVCRGTAHIAYEMVGRGITDAGKIQAEVDARWGPGAGHALH